MAFLVMGMGLGCMLGGTLIKRGNPSAAKKLHIAAAAVIAVSLVLLLIGFF